MEIALLNVYTNYVDAYIAKGVLEEQGIACWLQDENTVTIDPVLTNAVGGIKLLVKKEELGNAGYILQQLRKEQKASVKCPKCGSHNIELVSTPRKASNWVGAILGLLFTNYAIPVKKVSHCFDCSHEFQAE
jgi:hypothetical protein